MRRPWQIWLIYVLCLAIVVPAMGWLTHQTLHADKAEWQARLAAEREEIVNSVLWQMDTELTTLLAQEAARPHYVYKPFYTAPAVIVSKSEATQGKSLTKGTPLAEDWSLSQQLPSPLLMQTSPYVLLHFQIDADNALSSPQCPTEQAELALDNGASAENIRLSSQRLTELQASLHYDQLLAMLPARSFAETGIAQWQFNDLVNLEGPTPQNDAAVVGNTLGNPRVQQELEAQGYTQAPNALPQQSAAEPLDNSFIANNSRGQVQSRAGYDLEQRNRAYQTAAQRQMVEQRLNYKLASARLKYVSEGVSQPLWLGDRLILARRVKLGEQDVVQGCWLDWPSMQSELLARHATELPGVTLEPVHFHSEQEPLKVSRLLATLPAQLVVPPAAPADQPWTPLRLALVVSWTMLGIAAIAVASLLQGVITLSERRGAFVSAVTHELRTPLTTFRMYAEMLAENMVPAADTRQKYLETLRVEADRLSHLVENVLSYARLERGRQGQRREVVSLVSIVEHAQHRFADRAAQAEMQLVVEGLSDVGDLSVRTDPAAVEQILFNLIDNACKYAAPATDRRLHVRLSRESKHVVVRVIDHGPGIDAKAARRLFQPFSKSVHDAACSAPGVGLGLALSRRLAQQLGGRLVMEPADENGATFALFLPTSI